MVKKAQRLSGNCAHMEKAFSHLLQLPPAKFRILPEHSSSNFCFSFSTGDNENQIDDLVALLDSESDNDDKDVDLITSDDDLGELLDKDDHFVVSSDSDNPRSCSDVKIEEEDDQIRSLKGKKKVQIIPRKFCVHIYCMCAFSNNIFEQFLTSWWFCQVVKA